MTLPQGTVAFNPVSPQDPPYQGEVGQGGLTLTIGSELWQWDPVIEAYKWREAPGHDWNFIHPLEPVGEPPVTWYVRSIMPVGFVNLIPIQVGTAD